MNFCQPLEPIVNVIDLGYSPYQKTWDLQKDFQFKRIKGEIEDTLFLVEHEPVYTLGKNANENHLLQNYPENIRIFHVERGGDVTYHGPGQLVGYPIIDLHNYQESISWYMRSLEEVIIKTLHHFEINGNRKKGLTGVWVGDEKVASLGVRISRWVTMHGFALNVSTDLKYFDGIIPCGIFEYGMTSMQKILDYKINIDEVKTVLINCFKSVFNIQNMNEVN